MQFKTFRDFLTEAVASPKMDMDSKSITYTFDTLKCVSGDDIMSFLPKTLKATSVDVDCKRKTITINVPNTLKLPNTTIKSIPKHLAKAISASDEVVAKPTQTKSAPKATPKTVVAQQEPEVEYDDNDDDTFKKQTGEFGGYSTLDTKAFANFLELFPGRSLYKDKTLIDPKKVFSLLKAVISKRENVEEFLSSILTSNFETRKNASLMDKLKGFDGFKSINSVKFNELDLALPDHLRR